MRRRVVERLEQGEILYLAVPAVRANRFLTGGWISLTGIWIALLPVGLITLLLGLFAPSNVLWTMPIGDLAIAAVLFPIAIRHTRVIAFTDRNVVIMTAPMVYLPGRVLDRLPQSLLTSVRRGFTWETFAVDDQEFTVTRYYQKRLFTLRLPGPIA